MRAIIAMIGVGVAASVFAADGTSVAEERMSPQALLIKMAAASRTANYEGTFTYQHKDNPALQNFKIIHYVEGDQVIERLQYLNGPEREIVRTSGSTDCALTDAEERPNHFVSLGERLAKVTDHYRFEVRGMERVAGRIATVLMAIPQDGFRYSYYFSVDNESGLVLKSWLVDDTAKPLERYQFVELSLNPDLQKIRALPVSKLHRTAGAPCTALGSEPVAPLRTSWVPDGFQYLGYKLVKDHIDMLMFGDGLASFSVFFEKSERPNPEGVAQRGATLAAMNNLRLNGVIYRVTVVGEIPIASAQKILQSIVVQ